jgi:hypothetical protein
VVLVTETVLEGGWVLIDGDENEDPAVLDEITVGFRGSTGSFID